MIGLIYQRLGQRRVRCRYVNIEDATAQQYPDILRRLEDGQLHLPVVAMHGEVILHGSFGVNQMLSRIESEIEAQTEE